MSRQAEQSNEAIKKNNKIVYELLSERGKAIYFPKEGILSQSAEAKGKKYNATIGEGIDEDGGVMNLPSIKKNILIEAKDAFSYAPSYGKLELRKFWKGSIKRKNPSLKQDTITPIVTNALTHGLSIVGYLFVGTGDKVIVTDKFWENYQLIFENTYNGKLELFNTFVRGGLDINSFDKILNKNSGKQIILLNFPNNPAGYTITDNEAKEIIKIIKQSAEKGNKILVILDDAYFGLVYKDGIYKESLFAELAGLHENILAVKIDGATKEDYVWGFRVGFITFGIKNGNAELYSALEDKTAGAIRATISNTSNLSQSLLLKAYNSATYEQEKRDKYEILKGRFEKVEQVLKDKKYSQYFTPLPYNSGYFMCIELKKGLDAEKIRKILLGKYDTGVIVFGNLIRIAYSGIPTDKIQQVFENIYSACEEFES